MSFFNWLRGLGSKKGPPENSGKTKKSYSALSKQTDGLTLADFFDLRTPEQIKATIPRSWFTKKHTRGRQKAFIEALSHMSPRSRATAMKRWGMELRA